MIVLDTHVLVWAVDGDQHLGRAARAAIEDAGRTDRIAVSAITPNRLIVATARYCSAPLLTADRAILEYAAGGYVQVVDASR